MPCSLRCRTDICKIVKCFVYLPSPQIRVPLMPNNFSIHQPLDATGGCSVLYARLYIFLQDCFLMASQAVPYFSLSKNVMPEVAPFWAIVAQLKFVLSLIFTFWLRCCFAKSLKNSFLIKFYIQLRKMWRSIHMPELMVLVIKIHPSKIDECCVISPSI